MSLKSELSPLPRIIIISPLVNNVKFDKDRIYSILLNYYIPLTEESFLKPALEISGSPRTKSDGSELAPLSIIKIYLSIIELCEV